MKIYTKGGDKGMTSLVSGKRIRKDDATIEAYGTVDELNSFCGLLVSESLHDNILKELAFVQNCLFNAGSILAKDGANFPDYPQITVKEVQRLEQAIDNHSNKLSPLRQFILPSGSRAISLAHVCRTVARRAERRVIELDSDREDVRIIVVFLNRLSDYFFILARSFARLEGKEEVHWSADLE